jgi:RNA polymerase sigma factor (sigma-70 family)
LKLDGNLEKDLALFASIKQGDVSAFENIYNTYWFVLFDTAYKRLKDKEKCQDIIQNVFTDLWNRRERLEIENPEAYLHTAVRFQTLKAISQNAKNVSFVDVFDAEIISSLKTDGVLLEREAKHIIKHFINALPAKRRAIFLMHYFDELSTTAIARELNVSQKTVQNQLTTASHALRLRFTQIFSYALFVCSLLF